MTTGAVRVFYILLTHGAKLTGDVMLHPAASGQIANIRAMFPAEKGRANKVVWDYARKIHHIDDLPSLQGALRRSQEVKGGALIVDDLSRLFRICADMDRVSLLNDLMVFGDHLFSLRHRSKLSDLSADQKNFLVLHPERFAHWSVKGARSARMPVAKRADATDAARKASIASRQASAARRDAQISDLQRALVSAGKPCTTTDIAAEANRRLLQTARRLPWSERAVRDALRRVATTSSDKEPPGSGPFSP